MTKGSDFKEIDITPGVMPSTDATASDIPCWAFTYHCRFDSNTGRLRKLGGWMSNSFDYGNVMTGTIRTIYSATINQKVYTILGSNSELGGLIGSSLTNISPLKTTSVAVANSLTTYYMTLAANPISTTLGSNSVTVNDPNASRFRVNDVYSLGGATATGGVPIGDLNTAHVIRSIGVGTVTFRVATTATSTAAGGGASVVRSDGLLNVTSTANGLSEGQRVKISGATAVGGISAPNINQEFIIRNVTINNFDVSTAGIATSQVIAGGGTGTVYFPQIEDGNLNQGIGQGYGAGLYGAGLYGTALVSTTGQTYPRIWFADRFGDNITLNAGNSSPVYIWNGSTAVAPSIIAGAPTDVNYAFVDQNSNIFVTLGSGTENRIFTSDQGVITQWVASSTNQVFDYTVQGAGRLISHAPVDGYNLLFTEEQTYTMKYIGIQAGVYQIQNLDPEIGLIAPMARVSVNGIAYWWGQENFYLFRGGKIEVIPSNFSSESTILRYVFDNFNYSQRFKIFAWYNQKYDEIWFHYPSANSNECNMVARVNRKLGCWMPDQLPRTAGEYPQQNLSNPRLANGSTLYTHEAGANDDGVAMSWMALTKKFVSGKDTVVQTQIVPDSIMTGNIDVEHRTYLYPQSTIPMQDKHYTVAGDTQKVPVTQNGRYWDYTISGSDLDQTFLMGQWYEQPQQGATAP